MRFEGQIKIWNDERGFGFIEPDAGGQEIFVHIKAFRSRSDRPQAGQTVSFEVETAATGKKRAKNVEFCSTPRMVLRNPRNPRGAPAQWGTATLFALPAFLAVYGVMMVVWRPPLWFVGVYLAASVVTFFAYAIDKSAAQRRTWRTAESSLHILALLGGWPGALLAQQVLRHKSAKPEFRAVFWLTVMVNVVLFVALCSPAGRGIWPLR